MARGTAASKRRRSGAGSHGSAAAACRKVYQAGLLRSIDLSEKLVPPEDIKDKKIGIFLATGLGNNHEILPFIKQVFKHDGGFPSPNQFANSVSNAAAFFLARICEIKGVVLTISQEELSFEASLWLVQSYLESG